VREREREGERKRKRKREREERERGGEREKEKREWARACLLAHAMEQRRALHTAAEEDHCFAVHACYSYVSVPVLPHIACNATRILAQALLPSLPECINVCLCVCMRALCVCVCVCAWRERDREREREKSGRTKEITLRSCPMQRQRRQRCQLGTAM
jgi:hypothetical protein